MQKTSNHSGAALRITTSNRSAPRRQAPAVLGPCTLTESFRFASFFPFARIRRKSEYLKAPDRAVLRTNPASRDFGYSNTLGAIARLGKETMKTIRHLNILAVLFFSTHASGQALTLTNARLKAGAWKTSMRIGYRPSHLPIKNSNTIPTAKISLT